MVTQNIEGFRISPIQRRSWNLQQAGASPEFEVRAVVRLKGPLDRRRLAESLSFVISRHDGLRTCLQEFPGLSVPLQVVGSGPSPEAVHALMENHGRILSSAESISIPASSNFNCVLRPSLTACGKDEHLLSLRSRSTVLDVGSLQLIVQELALAYEALETGQPPALPPVLQYPEVAEWLYEILESEGTSAGRAFWAGTMSRLDGWLRFSQDRSLACSFDVGRLEVPVDSGILERLMGSEPGGEWTRLDFLFTGWLAVLERFGFETQRCIAVLFDGHSDEVLRSVVGPLTRPLPVLIGPALPASFRELVGHVTAAMSQAKAWQECFDAEAVSRADQEAKGNLLFPFCLEYFEAEQLSMRGSVRFELSEISSLSEPFLLCLSCHRIGKQVRLEILWNREGCSHDFIQRLAEGLAVLFAQALEQPDLEIRHLEIMTDQQRRTLLEDFNTASGKLIRPVVRIHQRFQQQAQQTPDGAAVAFEDQIWTYRELNCHIDHVAGYLVSTYGIGPESIVAICLERALAMPLAILAVLRAGAAYLPLDPDYPADRLDFMLRDSRANIVLADGPAAEKLKAVGVEAVHISVALLAGFHAAEMHEPSGKNPAYVIYTSGSTGKPKGVVVTHEALSNHMQWMSKEFPLRREDRVLQKTVFSFDASVWEFLAPLLSGACLVVARPGGHRDREYLLKCIEKEKITVLQVVPSQLQLLVEGEGLERCSSLRYVYCGGEALPSRLVEAFLRRLPEAEIYNLYGPTESTIDTAWRRCFGGAEEKFELIGKPVPNTRAYVLNQEYAPQPVGVPGELHIGGIQLARGYQGRPELTAERFVPDPFSSIGGERLYRTGDLMNWTEEGNLSFLGRTDHQVKIRGYRVELGEIEAELLQNPEIRQAAVVVQEFGAGENRLIAYVAGANASARINPDELRRSLKEKLPAYMVPAEYVSLSDLPVTSNGKIDRKRLPLLNKEVGLRKITTPSTAEEEILCNIWAEILNQPIVGVEDNFFDLGGHSLLAMQVVSRIRQVFQCEMPLQQFFETSTVKKLAEAVRRVPSAAAAPMMSRRGHQRAPLSYAQQRLWFLEQLEPGAAYNMPMGLRLRGELDREGLQASVDELVRRHDVLRTRFMMEEGGAMQVIAAEQRVEIEEVDLRANDEKEWDAVRLAGEEARRPFDLSRGPLLRMTLLRLGEQEHVMVINLHHIICDGWSLGVMMREMRELYGAYVRGEKAHLPELEVQYADYAVWQREWLKGEVLEREVNYWREQLEGMPELELPLDRRRAEEGSGNRASGRRGGVESFEVTQEVSEKLKELSRAENATLFMTLLGGFEVLLWRYTGQEDVGIGTAIANRNHAETEGMIGFFVNTLVLRVKLDGNPTFRELVQRVRRVALEAYAHQDVPFEKLVQELQPERLATDQPLFQVMVAMQNTPDEELTFAESQLTNIPIPPPEAKFDLMVNLFESKGRLAGTFSYRADLLDSDTIRGMSETFTMILAHVASKPDGRIREFNL